MDDDKQREYDVEIADYKTEHLLRIYRTGAIYRAHTSNELEKIIARALDNPDEKSSEREALVNQEAPCNRGAKHLKQQDI